MSFTVEDFHDLIELLSQRPEWRADLRRHVLSDELLELPALVRQLVEAQSRAEARLEGVEARLDRLEATVQALADAQARTELQIGELAASQRRLEDRQGTMAGRLLELDYAHQAPSYLSPIAIRLRVIDAGTLANLLDDAVETDRLTAVERDAIMRTDLVLSGRRRDTGQEIYILVEISGRIETRDVEQAIERAKLLERLGRPVLPAVAGTSIDDRAAALADEQGVSYALGGLQLREVADLSPARPPRR